MSLFTPSDSEVTHPYQHKKLFNVQDFAETIFGFPSIISYTWHEIAKKEINAVTGGTPRLINILCDNALLVGYARGVHIIDRTIVTDVVKNMTCWDLRISDRPPKPPQANQIATSK